MAGVPWSSFTVASYCNSADICAIVQAGVNKQITRDNFLTANIGDSIALKGHSAGYISISDNGGIGLRAPAGQAVSIYADLDTQLFLAEYGSSLNVKAGSSFELHGGGFCGLYLSDTLVHLYCNVGQSVSVDFAPATSADWAGDPTHLHEAINRIAHALASLLGHSIP